MISLLKRMRRKEWLMAGLCALLVLGQIYFDLRLPDYMSDLTVLIQTPGSTVSDIWGTGLEMLGCTLASALLAVICGYLSSQVAAGFSYTVRESVQSGGGFRAEGDAAVLRAEPYQPHDE